MAEITTAFNTAFRDFEADGLPSSGKHKPVKSVVRGIGPVIEAELAEISSIATGGVKWLPAATGSVRVRATANVAIATALENGDTLNGVVLATGNTVFLPYQTAPAENGLYTVSASGAAARAAFANSSAELEYIGFVVQVGTAGAGEQWTLPLAAANITVGTTALNFALVGIEPGYAQEVFDARNGAVSLDARLDPMQVMTDDYADARVLIDSVRFDSAITATPVGAYTQLVTAQTGFANLYTLAGIGNFNAVRILAMARPTVVTEATLANVIRAEVRDVSKTGTILARGSINIDPLTDWAGGIVVPLDTALTAASFAGPNFFVGFYAETKAGARAYMGTNYAVVAHFAGQSYYMGIADTAWVDLAGDSCSGIELVQLGGTVVSTVRHLSERPRPIDEELNLILLPAKIPAVVGREMNIYFRTITPARAELLDWWVRFTEGNHYSERYKLSAASAGNAAFAIEAFDPITGTRVSSASSTIQRVAANAGAGKAIKVLFIGDSTTAEDSTAFTSTLGYVEQVKALSTAEGGGGLVLTCIGTQGPTGAKHEGYSGTTANICRTSASSPFVFSGVFNFAQYMSTNGFAGVDYVCFMYGINDGMGSTNDPRSTYYGSIMAHDYELMIESIHAYDPNINVVILAPPPPSAEQDASGNAFPVDTTDGRGRKAWGQRRNIYQMSRILKLQFDGREAEKIHFHMPGIGVDTLRNMKRSPAGELVNADIVLAGTYATYAAMLADLMPADGRLYYVTDAAKYFVKVGATTKGGWREAVEADGVVRRQFDSVHPATAGYAQIARRIWDWFKVAKV